MWGPLAILLLVAVASADFEHGWKSGNEYQYLVRSRTFTGIDSLADQYSGIVIKALLTVQPQDTQTLRAKVTKPQFAHVHRELPGGWEAPISDQMLELSELPMSGKTFEIKMKHGVIRDLITDRDVPTWEVNMLKGIVSQLQVDTQGENAIKSRSTQVPEDEQPFGMFKAMEDSVGGKCEVLYDITPLPEHIIERKPELVPLPNLKNDGQFIDIIKTKNYSRCDQRMGFHSGFAGQTNWEPGSNGNGQFLSKSSNSRIVISGDLKSFTIQSSVTTNKMSVSPIVYDEHAGVVVSRINLTLASVKDVNHKLSSPKNPESTGNLVYTFNNPFSEDEQRRPGRPSIAESSKASDSSSQNSVSSSEEAKQGGGNRKHGSGSSSGSSSSISSSEEGNFWQPKPTLEDAPENPLLPFFVGNKGKAIGMSSKIDPVKESRDLISQIANELEDPNIIPDEQTLEKFGILTDLMRTMSRKQIRDMENNMHLSRNQLNHNDKSQAKKQNAWAVLRDAMTQAGTGPALLTIKDWIENGDVEGMEAAQIVSRIPKTALTPTSQYVNALFELVKNPQVKKQRGLNSTAVLAFTDLVRQSQVSNRTLHNRYPVHAFGRMSSKHHQAVEQEYIPYLAQELKNAIKDADSPRIQTYILALGNIGHPKILAVLEPYLEGKEPVSNFQRTMMVASLSKLAELQPKLARSVLYKLYLNTMDTHEVRCTAVYLLMKTNPPLTMLQRMAEFTNYDNSKHVNSAVKTSIESIAGLERPETRDLANKARAAAVLLNRQEYQPQYSRSYATDASHVGNLDLAYRLIVNYIGSDDCIFPRAWYIGLDTNYGGFKAPTMEAQAMISSLNTLANTYLRNGDKEERKEKSQAEKIAEILNIEPEQPVQIEGHLLMKSKYNSQFLAFDNHSIERIPEMVAKLMPSLKNGGHFNMNRMVSYEMTLSFPTEAGLPFVYSLNIPALTKLSGTGKLQGNRDGGNGKMEVSLVNAMKVQGRMGFITPFEHQQFSSGIDMNVQVHVPIKAEVELNIPKKSFDLKMWPSVPTPQMRLVHYSFVPYTSKHDILSLRPVRDDKNTVKIHTSKPETRVDNYPSGDKPSFILIRSADNLQENQFLGGVKNAMDLFAFPWTRTTDKYMKCDVLVDFNEVSAKEPVRFRVSVDSMATKGESNDSEESNEDWNTKTKAIDASDKEPDSEQRKKQFLKEAAEGIQSGKAYVVDIRLDTPGVSRSRNGLTVAWAASNDMDKTRTLLFWQFKLPDAKVNYEVCAAARSNSNQKPTMNFENAMRSKPKTKYDVDIRYGETCLKGGQIELKGESFQTEKFKQQLSQVPVVQKCKEQMQKGNKALRACQHATQLAMTEDILEVSMESLPLISDLIVAGSTMDALKKVVSPLDARISTSNPKNGGKNKIDFKVKMSENLESLEIALHTPELDALLPVIDVTDLSTQQSNIMKNKDDADIRTTPVDINQGTCVLDDNQAETFDGRAYPLKLGKCWHVAMTTYPKENPEKPNELERIPENMRVSVVTRDTENGKEVKINLGEKEVRLGSSGSNSKVTVNKRTVQVSKESGYKQMNNDELEFEIFELPSGEVRVISDKYQFDSLYDGKRIQIKAGLEFENSVRGLCGNFDGEPDNDFVAPKNCMMKKPEDFLASYALVDDECQGPSRENARRLEKAECKRPRTRKSNVINDYEAGRVSGARRTWGYHAEERKDDKECNTYRTKVIEHEDKICFTTRPAPACADSCRATETKEKNYQFHCMKRNEASLEMKKRVEKGANPDLTQKPVNLRKSIAIPLECRA